MHLDFYVVFWPSHTAVPRADGWACWADQTTDPTPLLPVSSTEPDRYVQGHRLEMYIQAGPLFVEYGGDAECEVALLRDKANAALSRVKKITGQIHLCFVPIKLRKWICLITFLPKDI